MQLALDQLIFLPHSSNNFTRYTTSSRNRLKYNIKNRKSLRDELTQTQKTVFVSEWQAIHLETCFTYVQDVVYRHLL